MVSAALCMLCIWNAALMTNMQYVCAYLSLSCSHGYLLFRNSPITTQLNPRGFFRIVHVSHLNLGITALTKVLFNLFPRIYLRLSYSRRWLTYCDIPLSSWFHTWLCGFCSVSCADVVGAFCSVLVSVKVLFQILCTYIQWRPLTL